MAAKIDSGIDTATISVFRQLPRNRRIISETRIDEMIASRTTLLIAARTNTDWSKSSFSVMPCGAAALNFRHQVARRIDDGDRRGVAMAQDQEKDRALAVDMGDLWFASPKESATWATSPSVTGTPLRMPSGSWLN